MLLPNDLHYLIIQLICISHFSIQSQQTPAGERIIAEEGSFPSSGHFGDGQSSHFFGKSFFIQEREDQIDAAAAPVPA